jgi:hypothetical protein
MALDINGYNNMFRNFAEFAQNSLNAGDGRTATITQTLSGDFAAPHSSQNNPVFFGSVTFAQRLVIDLTPEIPVVTDFKLSQTIES